MKKIASLVMTFCAFAGMVCAESEPIAMAWKWEPGEVLFYRTRQSNQQRMTQGDRFQRISQSQDVLVRHSVDAVADGIATVATTYEEVKMDIAAGVGPAVHFDSTVDPEGESANHPAVAPLAALVGTTWRMEVDREGQIHDVQGFDEVVDKMLEGMRKSGASGIAPDELRKNLADKTIRQQLEASLRVVPSDPVRVGETWKREFERTLPGFGEVVQTTTYTFEGIEEVDGENCAKIVSLARSEPAVGGGMNPAVANLLADALRDAEVKGAILFSLDRGRLVSQELSMSMSIESPPPPSPMLDPEQGPLAATTHQIRQSIEIKLEPGPESHAE